MDEPEDLTELLTVPVLRVVEVEELDVPRDVLEELAALRDVVFGVETEVEALRDAVVEVLEVPRDVVEELAAPRDVAAGVEVEVEAPALRTEGVAVVEAATVPRPVVVLLPAEPRPVTEVVVIFVASAFWRMSYALRTIPLPESERGVFALRSVNERSGCCAP